MAGTNGNGNAKAFGGIIAIVAVVAGVYAMVEPMNQRIDFLNEQMVCMRLEMTTDNERERNDATQFAALTTQFAEIEARVADIESWRTWWNRERLTTQAIQGEKIKTLERAIAGGASAMISGE